MGKPVYSTGVGRRCSNCGEAVSSCRCRADAKTARREGGPVRVSLEKKGRRGKAVTVVTGLPLSDLELAVLAKKLKGQIGAGGTVKSGAIELQGDHTEKVRKFLDQQGIDR